MTRGIPIERPVAPLGPPSYPALDAFRSRFSPNTNTRFESCAFSYVKRRKGTEMSAVLAVTEIRQLIEESQMHFEDRRLYLLLIHIHIYFRRSFFKKRIRGLVLALRTYERAR